MSEELPREGRCEVEYRLLVPTEKNARQSYRGILELAESISVYGLLHNLVVKKLPSGAYEVEAGERRRRALGILWFSEEEQIEKFGRVIGTWRGKVPVFITPGSSTDAVNLIENTERAQLRPWEEGKRLVEWYEAGYDQAWIASCVGKSRKWVQVRLDIGRFLSPGVIRAVENLGSEDIVSMNQLHGISQLHDKITLEPFHEKQLEKLEAILGKPSTVRNRRKEISERGRIYSRAKNMKRMKLPGHARPYVTQILEYLFSEEDYPRLTFNWK